MRRDKKTKVLVTLLIMGLQGFDLEYFRYFLETGRLLRE